MEMNINLELIRSERLKRAWSQEHLAQVAGLGVRTVQRVETTGNGSLETVKALAAVLEVPVEKLLVETPKPPLWKRPLNLVATVSAALGVLFTGSMLMPAVLAHEVEMNVALQVDNSIISQHRLVSGDGQPAEIEIDHLLKLTLTPRIRDQDKGLVLIEAAVYSYRDGNYQLVAKPSALMERSKASQIRIRNAEGEEFNLSLTPEIR